MRHRLSIDHCRQLLANHGITPQDENQERIFVRLLREAFILGVHLDTMKGKWKPLKDKSHE